jgi:hypothetical protein
MLGTPELPNVPGTKLETPVLMPQESVESASLTHACSRLLEKPTFSQFFCYYPKPFFFLLSLLINV